VTLSRTGLGLYELSRSGARLMIARSNKAVWPFSPRSLFVVVCLLIGVAGIAAYHFWTSACCANPATPNASPAASQGTAADRVEKLYSDFAVGTDAQGNEGYNAAQKAEQQLLLDFVASFQNPQKNSANQTAWDQEQDQLLNDALKYAGSKALDAAAMYWGETQLNLPVVSPEDLIAQANTMQVSGQAGEREFDQYMANYLAARFDTLNRLTGQSLTATSDIDGGHIPLSSADLQIELNVDEFGRTLGKSKPSGR
jgi:hypothetical protein